MQCPMGQEFRSLRNLFVQPADTVCQAAGPDVLYQTVQEGFGGPVSTCLSTRNLAMPERDLSAAFAQLARARVPTDIEGCLLPERPSGRETIRVTSVRQAPGTLTDCFNECMARKGVRVGVTGAIAAGVGLPSLAGAAVPPLLVAVGTIAGIIALADIAECAAVCGMRGAAPAPGAPPSQQELIFLMEIGRLGEQQNERIANLFEQAFVRNPMLLTQGLARVGVRLSFLTQALDLDLRMPQQRIAMRMEDDDDDDDDDDES